MARKKAEKDPRVEVASTDAGLVGIRVVDPNAADSWLLMAPAQALGHARDVISHVLAMVAPEEPE